jgi:hypothetical protein
MLDGFLGVIKICLCKIAQKVKENKQKTNQILKNAYLFVFQLFICEYNYSVNKVSSQKFERC